MGNMKEKSYGIEKRIPLWRPSQEMLSNGQSQTVVTSKIQHSNVLH